MRVAMLTNLTAQASLPVLKHLAESKQLKLQHVFFYNTLAAGRASPVQMLRQFGLKTVLAKTWQAVQGKLRAKLGQLLGAKWLPPRSAYEFASIHRLPYSLTTDMNSDSSRAQLTALDADVLLVCVCKNILRGELLSLPSPNFVNIHPSLLPNYRGPTPTFWMLYEGETQTGFTIHRMTLQVDRGEILAQQSLPLDARRSELQIELEVFSAAAEVLDEILVKLLATPSPVAELAPSSAGSYHTYPTPSQRQELHQRQQALREQR